LFCQNILNIFLNKALKIIFYKKIKENDTMTRDFQKRFEEEEFSQDYIAKTTKWDFLSRSISSDFQLAKNNDYTIQIKPGILGMIFPFLFMTIGLVLILTKLLPNISNISQMDVSAIIVSVLGLIFFFAGFLIQPFKYFRTFDKEKNLFWQGIKAPKRMNNEVAGKNFTQLHNIHAIQIISTYSRSRASENSNKKYEYFYLYEINLILQNGDRLNVGSCRKRAGEENLKSNSETIDFNSHLYDPKKDKNIFTKSQFLAKFLNVPFWHLYLGRNY